MSDKKILCVYVGAAAIVAPLLLFRDLTPDNELRYLSIADEALRNGSLFAFSNHGVPYADKPPLYLWFLMLSKWLFGTWHTWFLTLFSLVPTLVTVSVMERWIRPCVSSEYRQAAVAMLLTTALLLGSALVVRMDALMMMFIVLATREFYRRYTVGMKNEKRKMKNKERTVKKPKQLLHNSTFRFFTLRSSFFTPANSSLFTFHFSLFIFPFLLFLALFTKGLLGILIPLAGITLFLAMKRELRRWTEFFGLRTWATVGGLCAVWFLCAYMEGGASYLHNLLFHQTMDRAVNAFHHRQPLWYYCIAILYSLAPWTLLVIGATLLALRRKLVNTDLERLFLAMSVATFVLLTCISSKLAIYLLPMLPFSVCFAAMQLRRCEQSRFLRLCMLLTTLLVALSPLIAMSFLPSGQLSMVAKESIVAVLVIIAAAGVVGFCMAMRRQSLGNIITTMTCFIAVAVFIAGQSVWNVNPMIGYGSACREAEMLSERYDTPILIDRNIKNAADIDVYLPHFNIVDISEIDTVGTTRKAVLMTKGDFPQKLRCRLVGVKGPLSQPQRVPFAQPKDSFQSASKPLSERKRVSFGNQVDMNNKTNNTI